MQALRLQLVLERVEDSGEVLPKVDRVREQARDSAVVSLTVLDELLCRLL